MLSMAPRGVSLSVVLLLGNLLTLASASFVVPKPNLLQAFRHAATSNSSSEVDGSGQQQPDGFFTGDFEKMDELPNYDQKQGKKGQCHPKCRWDCGTSDCNTKCQPRCKAPKCVTACKKPALAKCKHVCKDPVCAVVCPPQCEHGACPKCKTVCGASICSMECGQGRCESQCADPDCTWDCKADAACAKPTCKMSCDTKVCSFGEDQKLPSEHEVPYAGQEIAWKGLGKIPAENLGEFAPQAFEKVQLPGGATMLGGAKLALTAK